MDPMAAEMMLKPCFMPSPSITYKLPPLSAPMTVCVPAIRAGPADMSKSLSDIDFQLAGVNQSRGTDPLAASFKKLSPDRKSTRLNSSHLGISYAVFCLKKKQI